MQRLIAGAAGATAVVLASACSSRPSTESAGVITELVARYDSVWAAKDSAAVAGLLAPDYAYFTSSGRVSGRAGTLGFVSDTSYVLTRAQRSEVEVVVAGPVARVSSRWQGTGRFQGRPVEDDQTCGQIWTLDGGRWLLFSEHCVNRPARDSAL